MYGKGETVSCVSRGSFTWFRVAGGPDLRATQAPARNLPLLVTSAGFTLLAWVTQHWFEGSGIPPAIAALERLGMTTVITGLPRRLADAPVPSRPVPVADRPRRLVAGPPATDSLSNWSKYEKRNPAEAGSLKEESIIVDAQQEMGFRLVNRNDGSPIMSN